MLSDDLTWLSQKYGGRKPATAGYFLAARIKNGRQNSLQHKIILSFEPFDWLMSDNPKRLAPKVAGKSVVSRQHFQLWPSRLPQQAGIATSAYHQMTSHVLKSWLSGCDQVSTSWVADRSTNQTRYITTHFSL